MRLYRHSMRSYRRYRRGVFGNCSVGVTLQMCNRVTNYGDMGTFYRPARAQDSMEKLSLEHADRPKCVHIPPY